MKNERIILENTKLPDSMQDGVVSEIVTTSVDDLFGELEFDYEVEVDDILEDPELDAYFDALDRFIFDENMIENGDMVASDEYKERMKPFKKWLKDNDYNVKKHFNKEKSEKRRIHARYEKEMGLTEGVVLYEGEKPTTLDELDGWIPTSKSGRELPGMMAHGTVMAVGKDICKKMKKDGEEVPQWASDKYMKEAFTVTAEITNQGGEEETAIVKDVNSLGDGLNKIIDGWDIEFNDIDDLKFDNNDMEESMGMAGSAGSLGAGSSILKDEDDEINAIKDPMFSEDVFSGKAPTKDELDKHIKDEKDAKKEPKEDKKESNHVVQTMVTDEEGELIVMDEMAKMAVLLKESAMEHAKGYPNLTRMGEEAWNRMVYGTVRTVMNKVPDIPVEKLIVPITQQLNILGKSYTASPEEGKAAQRLLQGLFRDNLYKGIYGEVTMEQKGLLEAEITMEEITEEDPESKVIRDEYDEDALDLELQYEDEAQEELAALDEIDDDGIVDEIDTDIGAEVVADDPVVPAVDEEVPAVQPEDDDPTEELELEDIGDLDDEDQEENNLELEDIGDIDDFDEEPEQQSSGGGLETDIPEIPEEDPIGDDGVDEGQFDLPEIDGGKGFDIDSINAELEDNQSQSTPEENAEIDLGDQTEMNADEGGQESEHNNIDNNDSEIPELGDFGEGEDGELGMDEFGGDMVDPDDPSIGVADELSSIEDNDEEKESNKHLSKMRKSRLLKNYKELKELVIKLETFSVYTDELSKIKEKLDTILKYNYNTNYDQLHSNYMLMRGQLKILANIISKEIKKDELRGKLVEGLDLDVVENIHK